MISSLKGSLLRGNVWARNLRNLRIARTRGFLTNFPCYEIHRSVLLFLIKRPLNDERRGKLAQMVKKSLICANLNYLKRIRSLTFAGSVPFYQVLRFVSTVSNLFNRTRVSLINTKFDILGPNELLAVFLSSKKLNISFILYKLADLKIVRRERISQSEKF